MSKILPLPSQERLQDLFDYSVVTGELRWKVTSSNGKAKAGMLAGYINSEGYRVVRVNGRQYKAHRIIWRLVTGEDPKSNEIDHCDLDRSNNAWLNLRTSTVSQNRQNSIHSTTKYKGVDFHRPTFKFRSRISINGVTRQIGMFPTPEEAHAAYCKAAQELHGDFARTN